MLGAPQNLDAIQSAVKGTVVNMTNTAMDIAGAAINTAAANLPV